MKCQNCGKEMVNFHYSSNINGRVTETHLCAECAERAGYSFGNMFGNMFGYNDLFSGFFGGMRPFMQEFRPAAMLGIPQMGILFNEPQNPVPHTCNCMRSGTVPPSNVDPEIQKRRELNMMREEMHKAAQSEDFERAAELRDKIRKLEG